MKTFPTLLMLSVAGVLAATGCDRPQADQPPPPVPPADQAPPSDGIAPDPGDPALQAGPEQAPPIDGLQPQAPISEAVTYACDDGLEFQVEYGQDSATVTLSDEQEVELPQVVSASGAHYRGEALSWWNRGTGGTLEQDEMPARQCEEVERAP